VACPCNGMYNGVNCMLLVARGACRNCACGLENGACCMLHAGYCMLLMQERVQVCVDVMHRLPDRQRADTAENCSMPACRQGFAGFSCACCRVAPTLGPCGTLTASYSNMQAHHRVVRRSIDPQVPLRHCPATTHMARNRCSATDGPVPSVSPEDAQSTPEYRGYTRVRLKYWAGVLCPACDSAPGTQPNPPSKLRQRATKSAAQCGPSQERCTPSQRASHDMQPRLQRALRHHVKSAAPARPVPTLHNVSAVQRTNSAQRRNRARQLRQQRC
jgi:hypothetical protein